MRLVIRLGNKEKQREVNQSRELQENEEQEENHGTEEYNSDSFSDDEHEGNTKEEQENNRISRNQKSKKTRQTGKKRRKLEYSRETPPSKRRRHNSPETPSRRSSKQLKSETQQNHSVSPLPSSPLKTDESDDSIVEQKETKSRGRGRHTTKNRTIEKSELYNIIAQIKESDTNQIFWYPVSEEDVPNYRKFIRHPMDISTIKKKLGKSRYSTLKGFMSDVNTMFKNAMSFNPEDTIYYQEAVRLQKFAQELAKDYIHEAKVVSTRKVREQRRRRETTTGKDGGSNLEKGSPSDQVLSPFHTKCIHVIDALASEDRHCLFYDSSKDDSPEYRKIVRHPMDFSILRRKVEFGDLNTKRSFKDNLYLIFNNVTKFFPPATLQHSEAVRLKGLATKIMSEFDRPLDPSLQIQSPQSSSGSTPSQPSGTETTPFNVSGNSEETIVSNQHKEEEEEQQQLVKEEEEEKEEEKEEKEEKTQQEEKEKEEEISLKTQLNDLIDVMKHEDKEEIFKQPVDAELVPEYYDVIKNPMDFSTIKKNIDNGEYDSIQDMHKHLELTFNNAKKFNKRSTIFHKEAVRLQKLAREIVKSKDPTSYAIERFPERRRTTMQQDTDLVAAKPSSSQKEAPRSKTKRMKVSPVLRDLLHEFMEFDKMKIFHQPVDTEEISDYLDYIEHPMDFSTMEKKLDNGEYKKIKAFERDFELICENAKLYNAKGTIYYKKADELWNYGKPKIDSIAAKIKSHSRSKQRHKQSTASISSPSAVSSTAEGTVSEESSKQNAEFEQSASSLAAPSLEAPPTATASTDIGSTLSPGATGTNADISPSMADSVSSTSTAASPHHIPGTSSTETTALDSARAFQSSQPLPSSAGSASSMQPLPQAMSSVGNITTGGAPFYPSSYGGLGSSESNQSFNAAAIIAAQHQQQQEQERRKMEQEKKEQQEQESEQFSQEELDSMSDSRRRYEENKRKRKYVKSGMYKRGRDGNFIVRDPKLRAAGVKMAHTIFKTTGINHAPVSQVFNPNDPQSQSQQQNQPQQPQQQVFSPSTPPQPSQSQPQSQSQSQFSPQPQPQLQQSQPQSQSQPQPLSQSQPSSVPPSTPSTPSTPQQIPPSPFKPTPPLSSSVYSSSPATFPNMSGSGDTGRMMSPPTPNNILPFIAPQQPLPQPPPPPPQLNATSRTTTLASQFTQVRRPLYSSFLTDITPISKDRLDSIRESSLTKAFESLFNDGENKSSLSEFINHVREKAKERRKQNEKLNSKVTEIKDSHLSSAKEDQHDETMKPADDDDNDNDNENDNDNTENNNNDTDHSNDNNNNDKMDISTKDSNNNFNDEDDSHYNYGNDNDNNNETNKSIFDDVIQVIGMGIDPSRDFPISASFNTNLESDSELAFEDILKDLEQDHLVNNNPNNDLQKEDENNENKNSENETGAKDSSVEMPYLSAAEFNDFATNILFNTI